MNQKYYLLSGAFLLTFVGFLTRIAGFFYKIFLSRTIGAEQIGLFQLTMPVFAFCMAFACGGIQTAVSRFTAEYHAKNDCRGTHLLLFSSLLLSGSLSIFCSVFLYLNAGWIAVRFLLEPRCTQLLQIIAISLPFCVIHSCLCGYFIGLKNIRPSALSQLFEQIFRIGSACFFYVIFTSDGREMNASIMALGHLSGEMASALYSLLYLLFHAKPKLSVSATALFHRTTQRLQNKKQENFLFLNSLTAGIRLTLSVSAPLGLNRMLLCILQGMEAALLPQKLQLFGYSANEALSVYGILTGMTLPLLLFPTAITSALGTLLLPAVSEARTLKQNRQITAAANTCFYCSLFFGCLFLAILFFFGKHIGQFLFHNEPAGMFLQKMALICPFLYLNTTMTSIVHGLGKSTAVFLWSTAGYLIRLISVLLFVENLGIDAYIYGTMCSQLFISVCIAALLIHAKSLTLEAPNFFHKKKTQNRRR